MYHWAQWCEFDDECQGQYNTVFIYRKGLFVCPTPICSPLRFFDLSLLPRCAQIFTIHAPFCLYCSLLFCPYYVLPFAHIVDPFMPLSWPPYMPLFLASCVCINFSHLSSIFPPSSLFLPFPNISLPLFSHFLPKYCSGPWKLESSRRLCWRGMLEKSEKGCREFGIGRGWGGVEKGEVSSRVTWDQGGRDPITPRRVSK